MNSICKKIFFAILLTIITITQYGWAKNALPLPRFASVKSSKMNLRVGPGNQYPIIWIYHKQHLPVMIVAEYENWRQIEDFEGTKGWVHHSMLSGKRYIMITKKNASLYDSSSRDARTKAYLDLNVIGLFKEANPQQVYIKVDQFKGWVDRESTWGLLKSE